MGSIGSVTRVVRPLHWVKNLLVLGAPVAAGTITETDIFLKAFLSMILFTLASSAVYVFNDMRDREFDALHPTKSLRPLVLGQISQQMALWIGFCCFSVSLIGGLSYNFSIGIILLIYFGLNIAYSLYAKNIPFIELFFVAAGFSLRSITGGIATDTHLTLSYVSVVSLSSLCLVSCKRFSELSGHERHDFRPVLNSYSKGSLFAVVAASIAGSILMYSIWVFQNQTTNNLLSSISLGIFSAALLRFGHLAKSGSCENPIQVLFSDRLLNFLLILWACIYVGAVYG